MVRNNRENLRKTCIISFEGKTNILINHSVSIAELDPHVCGLRKEVSQMMHLPLHGEEITKLFFSLGNEEIREKVKQYKSK